MGVTVVVTEEIVNALMTVQIGANVIAGRGMCPVICNL